MPGIKHLIQCHCTLAIYKKNEEIVNHKFPVYSFIDNLDNIIPKFVQCNNCGTIHFVKKIGSSEIKLGKDESKMIPKSEDIIKKLPSKIANELIKNNAQLADFEHALDVIDNNQWGSFIVLSREIYDDKEHVKILKILSKEKYDITSEVIEDLVIGE